MGQPQLIRDKRKEFDFRDEHFQYVRARVHQTSGIVLSEIKRDMVYSRLVRRLRALNISTFDEYIALIKKEASDEIIEFTNAITTNLTSFFRENHHFEFLKNTVFPQFIVDRKRTIRIWSAGCSTGEEPYSLAMVLADVMPKLNGADAKILATDLDSNVIATARQGIYTNERLQGMAAGLQKKWFVSVPGEENSSMQVVPGLKKLIRFNKLNLIEEWPMKGKFDVIFCRNVVIYFNKDTQRILFDRYADILNPNGYLIVGHSESLHGVTTRYRLLGKTIYQKVV